MCDESHYAIDGVLFALLYPFGRIVSGGLIDSELPYGDGALKSFVFAL